MRLVLFVVFSFLAVETAVGQQLQWDPSPSGTTAGYIVSAGTSPGRYTQEINVGNATSFSLASFDARRTYYFAVQSFDPSGTRSAYTPEVVRPALPPVVPDFGDAGGGPGTADIVWQHADGWLSVWHMDNQGTLAEAVNLTPSRVPDGNWKIVGTGDFDSDGKTDLIWQHKTAGWIAAWFMDGPNLRSDVLLTPSRVSDPRWAIVAVGDMDADGEPDLIWQHDNGTISVWLMSGTTLRDSLLFSPGSVPPNTWRIVAAQDFDADGVTDLLWQHRDGLLSVWYMDGLTLRDARYLTPSSVHPSWRVVGVADYSQDGRPDLLFQKTDGYLALWHMNGLTMTSSPLLNPPFVGGGGAWRIVGPH